MNKLRYFVLGCAALVASFFVMPAYAALDLELTQGIDAALPIAVVPFTGQEQDINAANNVAGVVWHDLQNSGQFRVKSWSSLKQLPSSSADVQQPYFKKLGVNDVLVGSVTKTLGGDYKVQYQLVNIFAKQGNSDNILLTQQFTVKKEQLRSLAHHIADQVYQKLTGFRGVFSTKIAYILVKRAAGQPTQHVLEIADADGYNPKPLLTSKQPIMSPAWSPDGKQLAYVSFENKKSAIYLQDIATGSRQQLTNFPGINGAPAFSPDGKQLAMVLLSKQDDPKIFIMNLQKKRLKQITFGRSIDTEPAFSPDGQSIAFTSNRGGSPQIYLKNLKKNTVNRLTFDGNYNAKASFSPDGKSVALMSRGHSMFAVGVLTLANQQLQILTQGPLDESPSMAPNGQMVLFASRYGGREVLSEVSIDGRIKLRLPARDGSVQEPAWSPFFGD